MNNTVGNKMTKLIIDTDIGSDTDDALALTYAIACGMDVRLITTVHGDTILRAKIAKKLTQLLGVDIPVAAGEANPIKQTYIFQTGLEGKGFIEEVERDDPALIPVTNDGVEALARCIDEHQHDVNIASIGPLTNIAKAFQRYPDLASKVNHIYMMGNAITCGDHLHLNYRSHNFKVDPEAIDAVMEAKVPKTIITTQICKRNKLLPSELEELKATGNPVLGYIHDAAIEWMKFIKYDCVYLYDPLVVQHHLDPSVTQRQNYNGTMVSMDADTEFKEKFLRTILTKYKISDYVL